MALLLVLFILVLGYQYAAHIPAEQIKLRRSTGWETYVYLGFHGLRLTIIGLFIFCILTFPLYASAWFLDTILNWFSVSWKLHEKIFAIAEYELFDGLQIYHIAIVSLAYGIGQNEVKKRQEENWRQQILHYDGMLRLLMQSMYISVPVRISLKSRKVYVGIVSQEQFSNAEFDYIFIIPLLSGYRDKDILDVFYDCNYYTVYNKHHLFDDDHLNDEEILQLEDFRLAIRGSEIESVALFKLEVSSDFEYYIKPSQNQTIENTH